MTTRPSRNLGIHLLMQSSTTQHAKHCPDYLNACLPTLLPLAKQLSGTFTSRRASTCVCRLVCRSNHKPLRCAIPSPNLLLLNGGLQRHGNLAQLEAIASQQILGMPECCRPGSCCQSHLPGELMDLQLQNCWLHHSSLQLQRLTICSLKLDAVCWLLEALPGRSFVGPCIAACFTSLRPVMTHQTE